ncbi:uncharacterized protein LOC143858710 isoform X2 [Tasmannia lanceolata]
MQCQKMHSSIGTGTLAHLVGSKVMDMRTLSKDNGNQEVESKSGRACQDASNRIEAYACSSNDCTGSSFACQRESSSDSGDLVSVRGSTDSAAYDSSSAMPSSSCYNGISSKPGRKLHGLQYAIESYFDFPPLPVTNLFQKSSRDEIEQTFRLEDGPMHSFQIDNNIDLIMESNTIPSINVLHASNGEIEMFASEVQGEEMESKKLEYKNEIESRLGISDVPEAAMINATTSNGVTASEDRVSDWLWTLHRIVVDVVRTDSHLEFYGDTKNMARMSDILAVYAWVDPATGYCQGMSDLLSPFVVLYEDNADAFWCFEMLLRRMRENFQMEGPTGVMKQLQALWRILELTDTEMFTHLSKIGAESLHFAFRMLLVLFRRELTFSEVLCMWEMMWAADFDEAIGRELEENCLEPLVLQLPRDSDAEIVLESLENGKRNSNGAQSECSNVEHLTADSNGARSISNHPFCGLTRASFWARHGRMHSFTITSSMTRNEDDELPVFCVAAILIINRQKIIRETHSIDDLIKMFNDNMLKIKVKRCIRMAIKLRKKYFYKLIKQTSTGNSEQ